MKQNVLAALVLVLLTACNQTDHATDTKNGVGHELAAPVKNISKLDSLDKANQAKFIAEGDTLKAFVYLKDGDSSIYVAFNKFKDHRFFGYSRPDLFSERLLLFSIYTSDVQGNPFGCRLGAYYDDSQTPFRLKYLSRTKDFIKAVAIDSSNHSTELYFEKSWVEFQ